MNTKRYGFPRDCNIADGVVGARVESRALVKELFTPMGNNCVGPNVGNGFLQSVTAAVWKTRPPESRLPPPSADSKTSTPVANAQKASEPAPSKPSDPPNRVQNTPPEPVKMPEPLDHEKPASSHPESTPDKAKKPTHVKRNSSMGLQVDSVLGRKTENMKEFFSLGRKLGQGQFGTTFMCVQKGTNKEFACKSIAKRKLTTQEDVEDVRREIQIMHHLAGHPNVVQIVGAYEDAVAVHLVMELCAGGELFDRIIQRGHYTERKAADLARLIVSVVEACHSLGVMHRDLKPENFLFMNQQEESPLKTIDFGLSVFFRPGIPPLFLSGSLVLRITVLGTKLTSRKCVYFIKFSFMLV